MSKKLTIKDMQTVALEKGGWCLSPEYFGCKDRLWWQCGEGHIWKTVAYYVKFGHWCPYCAGVKKKTIEDMQTVALEKGGWCLSTEYVDNKTKLWWQCKEGHIWDAPPQNVTANNTWCPVCFGLKRKYTIEDMQNIALERGGWCLSTEYVDNKTKLWWQCKEGHIWDSNPNSIMSSKSWCPECATNYRLTIEEMQNIALERGGWCLSPEYFGSDVKLWWQCGRGHVWKTKPEIIKTGGSWCPTCASRRYRSENACRKFFEAIFDNKFPNKRPDWLRDEKGEKLQLDGYCKELGLAFEYQGEHHYKKIYYLKNKSLEDIQRRDKLKIEICKKNNVVLIQVPFTVSYNDVQEYIIQECKKKSVILPENIPVIDYTKFDIYSLKLLEEMQEIAKSRGGKCLSKVYIGVMEKMEWKCSGGHIWKMSPNDIKSGHWCPKCGGVAKLNIEEMQLLAKKRGGECLSTKYINNKTPLKWKCSEGHIWKARPDKIKDRRQWCPYCAGKYLTIEDMQKVASDRGGKCLSMVYLEANEKLMWECSEGHKWKATANMVKNDKTWCPTCSRIKRKYKQFPHKQKF